MTADELWESLAAFTPAFARPDEAHVTLTVRGLRRLVDVAHAEGARDAAYGEPAEIPDEIRALFGGPKHTTSGPPA